MSQVYKDLTAGPVPPSVATSYVTDVNSPAIPAANVLNVIGGDTTANNENGIRTDGSSGSNTLTVQLTNRIQVTATTSDGAGQTQNVALLTPAVSSSLSFTMLIAGYDVANNEATGGELLGLARRSAGGVTVVVGTNDSFDEADAALLATDWDVVAATPVLNMQFVGVAGRTIVWTAVFNYCQAS